MDKSVESGDVAKEGLRRSNLGDTLRKLRRLDEARQEIRRAIECDAQFGHASEPWKAWAILAHIETDAGNPTAAVEANRKAIDCYLAYRRDGGENHDGPGRLVFDMTEKFRAGGPAAAASLPAGTRHRPRRRSLPPLYPSPPSHRRRQPRPQPRRRPGFELLDGRRNPLPDRDAGESGEVKTRGESC